MAQVPKMPVFSQPFVWVNTCICSKWLTSPLFCAITDAVAKKESRQVNKKFKNGDIGQKSGDKIAYSAV